jgi:Vitamin B6 photo-protection and homoeostasis
LHRVSADYARYQLFDSLQALCSTLSGLLATRAVLEGLGVGRAEANVSSAVANWIIRDGTGMLGRILFAWLQGLNLDRNCKTWRFMADILLDISLSIELLSGALPVHYFLLLSTVASVLKSVVGVAGGCTRAALTLHQARRNNMADVSAKDGSQETAVGLVGMLLGLLLTSVLPDSLVWHFFTVLTALHLLFNYYAGGSAQLGRGLE